MIDKLPAIIKALFYGRKLQQSAAWKDIAAAASAFSPIVLWAIPWLQSKGYLPADMTHEEAQALAMQIATAVLMAAAYFFKATSDTVGFGNRESSSVPPPIADPDAGAPVDYHRDDGVLYRIQQPAVPAGGSASRHPGADPGLDSFNQ